MTEVHADVTGNVWRVLVAVGDAVEDGQTLMILESMKMEIPVEAELSGTVAELRVEEGQSVNDGETLLVIR